MTKERNLLGETAIVGLRAVKEAVRIHDPQHSRPEKVPITKDIKDTVRPAHAMYLKRIEEEKAEESKKQDEIRRQRKEKARKQKEQEKMLAGREDS